MTTKEHVIAILQKLQDKERNEDKREALRDAKWEIDKRVKDKEK